MIRWSDIYERQEHYRGIARALDEERFARQVSTSRVQRESVYRRLLFRLGRQLSAWGMNLQRHSSADLSPSH